MIRRDIRRRTAPGADGRPRAASRRPWRAVAAGLALAAGVLAATAPMPTVATGAARAAGARPPNRHGGPERLRGAALPDTVLAAVGAHREVTRSEFVDAWNRVSPPARPDSLTPEGARRFLDLMVDKEALAAAAGAETWTWTARESARYDGLRDRLVLKAVLDSALDATRAALRARGDSVPDDQRLGIEARERAVARLAMTTDDTLVASMAHVWAALPRPTADSSMFAQIRMMGQEPAVDSTAYDSVLATSNEGPYRVSDLLAAWHRLNPLYRPRITTADQVRDLLKNGLYERLLRRDAERRGLVRRPDIASRLDRQAEFIAVSHLVAREVYAPLDADTTAIRAFYQAHVDDWTLPLRIRLTRLEMSDRASAEEAAVTLHDPVQAESLVVQARRKGIDYTGEVSAETDSTVFAAALRAGTGSVIGPLGGGGAWTVARVDAVVPPRRRSFAEAKTLVKQRWYGEEGERLMRALCDSLRARQGVRVNERALERLAADPPPGLVSAPPGTGRRAPGR